MSKTFETLTPDEFEARKFFERDTEARARESARGYAEGRAA